MGLPGCQASLQRLMEGVLSDKQNVLVYSDDLLIHADTHEKHLLILDQVLNQLQKHHLKINLERCFFGVQQVSYLGFTLTLEGIKPGQGKLKAIQEAEPPTAVKSIRSFVGLCNFFWNHIKDLGIRAAPLFKLTGQKSGYSEGPLTDATYQAFQQFQQQLILGPVLPFPWSDR